MLKKTTRAVVRGNMLQTATRSVKDVMESENEADRAPEADRILAARRQLVLLITIPLMMILSLLLGFLLLQGMEQPVQVLNQAGELLAVPVESSLAQEASPGDLVQLYAGTQVIPTMRYVQVSAVSEDSLNLIVSSRQMQDYLDAKGGDLMITLVVHGDPEAAQEKLELQESWNNPEVTLHLSDSLSLEVGSSQTLEAQLVLEPEEAVSPELIWASSEPEIIAVDEGGTLTALASGEATVTLSCGEVSASCTVSAVSCAEKLRFEASDIQISVGGTAAVGLASEPEDITEELTWVSSDPDVATVEDGEIFGVHAGTAQITVTGRRADATIKVTVTTEATDITLNRSQLALQPGETGPLAAAVTPADATNKAVSWVSSDPNVATVSDEGLVTGVTEGEATITASCGEISAVCKVTVAAAEAWPSSSPSAS